MNTSTDYKCWDYHQVRHVPVTPNGGGKIEWQERVDYRKVYLPSGIKDPASYLADAAKDEFREYVEFRNFIDVKH